MHQMREEVRKASQNLAIVETLLANARADPTYPREAMNILLADMRIKSAELATLQKKLAPLETNFQKAQAQGKPKDPIRQVVASPPPQQPAKKQKTEDRYAHSELITGETQASTDALCMDSESRAQPSRQSAIALKPITSLATRDITSPSGECALTAEKCQYDHLDRLRRQYARPFELFCAEMDSISDSCMTGICLALPDQPWSIAVSRLAFLLKSTLDSHNDRPRPSEARCTTVGATIGCEKHARYIRLAEIMAIENWRDFIGWVRHHSHVINLCGQRSCIKLKHICLEPVDCMAGRSKCRTGLEEVIHDTTRSPLECNSPDCWPPCLPQHAAVNILHSVAVEFAAFHQVSFGPVTSDAKKGLCTPISEHQLGKLVNNDSLGLKFPFGISYGPISVSKVKDGSFVNMATPLQISSMYTWEEMQSIAPKLPSWTEISFDSILSSIFWYARKRYTPLLASNTWIVGRFAPECPKYQCPYCHGFDDNLSAADSFAEAPTDFGDLLGAVRHILFAHNRVPTGRKVKFLYEETQHCPSICDAWRKILQDKFDTSMVTLAKGEVPKEIAGLCGYKTAETLDSVSAVVDRDMVACEDEEGMATRVKNEPDYDDRLNGYLLGGEFFRPGQFKLISYGRGKSLPV